MVRDTIRCKNCKIDRHNLYLGYCSDCKRIERTITKVVVSAKPVVLDDLNASLWETVFAFRVKVYKKSLCFDSYTDSYDSYELDDVDDSWESWMTHLPISKFNKRDGDRLENMWPYYNKIVYEGNCYFIDETHGEVVEKFFELWRVGNNIYNYQCGS